MSAAEAMPTTNARTAYGLLNAITRLAKDEPRRIRMSIVCMRGNPARNRYERTPACGTVGCIAGWALVLAGRTGEDERNFSDWNEARILLGLSHYQAERLFLDSNLVSAPNQQSAQHAEDVVEHIRKFQKAHKAQLQATPVSIPEAFQAPAPKGGQ